MDLVNEPLVFYLQLLDLGCLSLFNIVENLSVRELQILMLRTLLRCCLALVHQISDAQPEQGPD